MTTTDLRPVRRVHPRLAPLAVLYAWVLVACHGAPELDPEPDWPRPRRGAVVSEHPLATAVGLRTLDRGGNAADAAVATAFALAVVYPQAGNLGGGGFAIWAPHADPDAAQALDFREKAPRLLVPELFLDDDGDVVRERSMASHLAVGVPGSPAGLEALHRAHGVLPWRDVVTPAIDLADEGFEVDPWLARSLRREPFRSRLLASSASRRLFYPSGEPLSEGDLLRQPELAQTLRGIASEGAESFYSGDVANALATEMRTHSGVLDERDLADYAVRWTEPLEGTFRGNRLLTMPPPSSGGVMLLQVLAILDGFPLDSERDRARRAAADASSAEERRRLEVGLSERALHWWIEALRAGFADRAEHLGDPDFTDVPIAELLSPDWIADRRTSIGEQAAVEIEPWSGPVETGGETTHLCVLDRAGNAVSLTTTLNSTFGSGIMVPGIGVLLNNEIDDFSIQPGVPNDYGLVGSEANQLAPRKRPLSSMTPTVVMNGGGVVTGVVGSPGGPRIISSVIQVLLRILVHEQALEDAIRAPRLHQQWKPEWTYLEPGWDRLLEAQLSDRGHEVRRALRPWASVQGILVGRDGEPAAFSDPRRGGAAGLERRGIDEPARPVDYGEPEERQGAAQDPGASATIDAP
ncbi:MAG: gamma-glutamyltransferase [Planctomycetota bacterium]